MTWDEFVVLVEVELKTRDIPRTRQLRCIDWDSKIADVFGQSIGGPVPSVYISDFPKTNEIGIHEDEDSTPMKGSAY